MHRIYGYKFSIAAALAALCAYALSQLAPLSPSTLEKIYARGIYPLIMQPLSLLTGLLPFSLAEILLLALPLLIVLLVVFSLRRARGRGAIWPEAALQAAARLVGCALLLLALFVTLFTLNYTRLPYADIAGLHTRDSSAAELKAACEYLIREAALLREQTGDLSEMPFSDIRAGVAPAYRAASPDYPWLGGWYGAPKPVLLSRALCFSGTTGIFIPFTGEANVNTLPPAYSMPATACHEAAHQRGFAREDECNFIAYAVCQKSPDARFRYSGVMLALSHALNAYAAEGQGDYAALWEKMSDEVRADFEMSNAFWAEFETPVMETANNLYDAYLKSQGQQDGIKSYGRMVDLLLASLRETGNIIESKGFNTSVKSISHYYKI